MNCCHLLVTFITPSTLGVLIYIKNIRAFHGVFFPFTSQPCKHKARHHLISFIFPMLLLKLSVATIKAMFKSFLSKFLCT